MDYKALLRKIYMPEVGSIWKAPNNIWTTSFARNKDDKNYHPSIVERLRFDGVSVQLAPGTSKDYKVGSCVYQADLFNNGKTSYFLLKLSMPYVIESLLELDKGWNGIEYISNGDLDDFKWKIKICKG